LVRVCDWSLSTELQGQVGSSMWFEYVRSGRFKLARCGYTLRVTSQSSYSPEYITPSQKKS
jgi:hypothetical protein